MSDAVKRSHIEELKEGSHQLRGTLAEELQHDREFNKDSEHLIKNHGIYQQDDRDTRKAKNPDGTAKGKSYIFMVRTRIPGGKVSAKQFLDHLEICDEHGNGTLRVTTRQGFQLHGVIKNNLKQAVKKINDTLLTTLAACGDVERNVMCCPAPIKNNRVHDQMQAMADAIAEHLKPRTTAYHEIWLTDDAGEKTNVAEFKPVDEPIYGTVYLPRKFKTAIALPEDNCIDIYTQDLGFLAVVENDQIVGYNVLVGGGQGKTPSAEKTFVAIAQKLAFVTPDQVVKVAEAIVKVQRDFGNREDRKLARLKYTIHRMGLESFKAKVDEYYGQILPGPRDVDVTDVDDHIGWHEQGDGKLFLGINIECGRIKDEGSLKIKTGLRAILKKYGMQTRLTALQSVILCDIDPKDKADIIQLLVEHGIKQDHELTLLRRYSIACPAFPTCGLSITESERALPGIIDELEVEMAKLGIHHDRIAVHMTGCPNGCARPYTPDIGLVGKQAGVGGALGKYTIYLGGNAQGTRLAYIYKDSVPQAEVASTIAVALRHYKANRVNGESFGDFCHRCGQAEMQAAVA
ncbi:NADPH-dependent assimilatory sulfite reductase hemoprotein subunit [Schlesneria paludicola]|uniref:NADPH-dependent assimilatory sulfite reductase hemoprotein subunit n=1 Tax=Schlesneria paludicola TaxID=360056 RepID=UPI00029AAE0C|nr:NADPH-dependent assimilatory sulfite reductase hemoprotein subunit [Schlesneria paludicola]